MRTRATGRRAITGTPRGGFPLALLPMCFPMRFSGKQTLLFRRLSGSATTVICITTPCLISDPCTLVIRSRRGDSGAADGDGWLIELFVFGNFNSCYCPLHQSPEIFLAYDKSTPQTAICFSVVGSMID